MVILTKSLIFAKVSVGAHVNLKTWKPMGQILYRHLRLYTFGCPIHPTVKASGFSWTIFVIICAEWEPPSIIPLGQIEDLFAKQNIVVSGKDQFVPLLTNIFQGSALIHTI